MCGGRGGVQSNRAAAERWSPARVIRRAHLLPSVGSVHEAIHVEGCIAAKHVVGSATDPCGEDTEGFAPSVLGTEPVDETLATGVPLKEEDGGLTVGPFEMGVADLGAGGAHDLPGRGLLALYEAGIGEEVLDAGEAGDVVDLVEQREGENASDALAARSGPGQCFAGGVDPSASPRGN